MEDIEDHIMEDMDLEGLEDLDQFHHRHRDCSHHRLRQVHLCRLRHDHVIDMVGGKRHILVCLKSPESLGFRRFLVDIIYKA